MKPKILFVTYLALKPTGMFGVFKRCLRLIRQLLHDFEVHLVTYGPLPEEDPLLIEVRPLITIHEPVVEGLGDWLESLMKKLAPSCLIIGESPLRGSMRLAYRVASAVGIWQIAIENYYGRDLAEPHGRQWPNVDRWLMLGLAEHGASCRFGNVEVIPPLIKLPPGHTGFSRDRVTIIGYDKQTVLSGTRLIRRLPSSHKVDIFIVQRWQQYLERQCPQLGRAGLRVLVLPPDSVLYDSLARTKLLLGKAGFQQVVESLAFGAPVICQASGGGLQASLVPDQLLPYVRFIASEKHLSEIMIDIAAWLIETPFMAWTRAVAEIADPIAFAGRRLARLIDERPGTA
jgi:hypothetical protein